VDLAGVAETPVAALYSESAGRFLVTVAPTDLERFEALMTGAPVIRLGRVRADHRFAVQWGDRPLIQNDVWEMKEIWKKRFGDLV
jgi:phosphoribosylformylglycinamidine synthase